MNKEECERWNTTVCIEAMKFTDTMGNPILCENLTACIYFKQKYKPP